MKKILILITMLFLLACVETEKQKTVGYIEFAENARKTFCIKDEGFYFYIEYYKSVDDFLIARCASTVTDTLFETAVAKLVDKAGDKVKELEQKKEDALSSCRHGYNIRFGKIFEEIGRKGIYVFQGDSFSVENAGRVKRSEITFFIDDAGKKYRTEEVILLEKRCHETKLFFQE